MGYRHTSDAPLPDAIVASYREQGYAIVRQLFSPAEVAEIGAAVDDVHAEALAHGRSFRHGNLFYRLTAEPSGCPSVRMAQWIAYQHPRLDAVRLDPRWMAVLAPLIGGDVKQIVNQLHWKPQGGSTDFAWHQDSRFRRPAEAYRDLGSAYVQTGLAIDPHRPESGCMRIVPGSHRHGDLQMAIGSAVMSAAMHDDALRAVGLDPAHAVDLVLEPGDVALWSPYLVHASGSNRAAHQRRFYINGYVRADACDRGEWAFRTGQPVALGAEPALVHYEQLYERPEPHYP